MSTKILQLTAVATLLLVIGAGCGRTNSNSANQTPVEPPTTSISTTISPAAVPPQCTPANTAGDVQGYATDQGFCFQYSKAIFTPTTTMGETILKSPYYVEENYKGTPGGGYRHNFAIQFFVDNRSIKDAMGDPSGAIGFHPAQGIDKNGVPVGATAYSASGKNGYRITQGIEGTNVDYVFLPMSDNKTLVVIYTYFTDFLKKNVKPKAFSQAQEQAQFNSVMKSIKFY